MSAETKAALDDAIAAHVADEGDGALPTGYVLQISAVSMDDLDQQQIQLIRAVQEGQNFITTLGLIEYAKRKLGDTIGEDEER